MDRARWDVLHGPWRYVNDGARWPMRPRAGRPVRKRSGRRMRAPAIVAHDWPVRAVAEMARICVMRSKLRVTCTSGMAGLVDNHRRWWQDRNEADRRRGRSRLENRDIADARCVVSRELLDHRLSFGVVRDVEVDQIGLIEAN